MCIDIKRFLIQVIYYKIYKATYLFNAIFIRIKLDF